MDDDKLGRLPSREFLATTVIAVSGTSLAAAPVPPQPIVVVVPASPPLPSPSGPAQQKPVSQP